jgi:hypothetical protein
MIAHGPVLRHNPIRPASRIRDLPTDPIAVVKDATAAPRHPAWGGGYTAALVNFKYLANAAVTMDEVVDAMRRGKD